MSLPRDSRQPRRSAEAALKRTAVDEESILRHLHQGSDARSEGGKGLGLAIVKRIAELHGGSVAVQSAPGVGTTVTICSPAA